MRLPLSQLLSTGQTRGILNSIHFIISEIRLRVLLARRKHLWVLYRQLELFVASQTDAGTVSLGQPEKENVTIYMGFLKVPGRLYGS